MADTDEEYTIYSGYSLADVIEAEIIPSLQCLGAQEAATALSSAVGVLRLQHKFMRDKRDEAELRVELEHQLAVNKRWESLSDSQLDRLEQLSKINNELGEQVKRMQELVGK